MGMNGVWLCMLEKEGYCLWWTAMHNAAFSVSSTFIQTHTHTLRFITCIEKQGYKSHLSHPLSLVLSFKRIQSHINTFQIAYAFIIASRCSVVKHVALQIAAHKTHSGLITNEALNSVAIQSLPWCDWDMHWSWMKMCHYKRNNL